MSDIADEIQPGDLASMIRAELAQAQALDQAAREHRRQAGRLLALAREQAPTGSGWFRDAGIADAASARLLIQLAAGGLPYEFER